MADPTDPDGGENQSAVVPSLKCAFVRPASQSASTFQTFPSDEVLKKDW